MTKTLTSVSELSAMIGNGASVAVPPEAISPRIISNRPQKSASTSRTLRVSEWLGGA